jgi:hypothetical protein
LATESSLFGGLSHGVQFFCACLPKEKSGFFFEPNERECGFSLHDWQWKSLLVSKLIRRCVIFCAASFFCAGLANESLLFGAQAKACNIAVHDWQGKCRVFHLKLWYFLGA